MKIAVLAAALVIFVANRYGRCMTIDQILAAAQSSSDGDDDAMDHPGGDDSVVIEWDMVFTREELEEFRRESPSNRRPPRRRKRKAKKNRRWRWTDKTIPYEIARDGFGDEEEDQILQAISEWNDRTCLNFRPKEPYDRNYVYFEPVSAGCNSRVGMVGGRQAIKLAPDCSKSKKLIAHEIGHAIGFVHEQNRPDRDQYVTINRNNIMTRYQRNFDIYSTRHVNTYGIAYDYRSLMHYGQDAFGKDGLRTITTTNPRYQDLIGEATTLSAKDIELAKTMYGCPGNRRQRLDAPECSDDTPTTICEFSQDRCAGESMRKNCKKTCGYCQ